MRLSISLIGIAALTSSLSLTAVSAGPNKFCEGDFEPNAAHCKKFDFPSSSSSGSQSCTGKVQHLANCTTFYDISKLPEESIDDHTAKMAQLITNVFENGDTKMGYAYVEKLGDCRGYTSGYIGFTTGTNDAYMVVTQYLKRHPKSKLKKYLPELRRLSKLPFGDAGRDNISGLKGYSKAWQKAACKDAEFIQTQLDVGHAMYLKPALKYAASVGIKSNLGKALFYDTIIQHGWQYVEPDINLPRIIELTGPMGANETEKEYLTRFLTTRRQLVCCYPGDVWNESSDRMSDLQKLVDAWEDNKDLRKAVHLETFGVTIKGDEDMSWDSQNCKKAPKNKNKAKSVTLPIPDTCPNPLLS